MNLPEAPVPSEGLLVTHFLTVADQVKSREFYADVLGGKVLAPENPSDKMVALFQKYAP